MVLSSLMLGMALGPRELSYKENRMVPHRDQKINLIVQSTFYVEFIKKFPNWCAYYIEYRQELRADWVKVYKVAEFLCVSVQEVRNNFHALFTSNPFLNLRLEFESLHAKLSPLQELSEVEHDLTRFNDLKKQAEKIGFEDRIIDDTACALLGSGVGNHEAYELQVCFSYKDPALKLKKRCLSSIPFTYELLVHLKKINLKGNYLRKFPRAIKKLTELTEVDLSDNRLNSVSGIEKLQKLVCIRLCGNELKRLPTDIGNLSNLEVLELAYNDLKTLPKSITKLSHLLVLSVSYNRITELPDEIKEMSQLKKLGLSGNRLAELPQGIMNLNQLEVIELARNALTIIPPILFYQLRQLIINSNPNLYELPLTLGEIPGLTNLDISGTKIPQGQVEAILSQCRAKRKKQALLEFPKRLESWQTAAKTAYDFNEILQLDEEERGHINEWLVRNTRTKDFQGRQEEYAKVILAMLVDAPKYPAFKDAFLAELIANNENCEDRAAMTTNQIYTAWKILTHPLEISLAEKLNIMMKAGKTLALRKYIAQKLHAKGDEAESVEIYLYYELSAMKKGLELLSVTENMSYKDIGKRDWINLDYVIRAVNKNYLNEVVSQPLFEKLALEDKGLKKACERLNIHCQKNNKTTAEYEKEKRALYQEWFLKKIGN